MATNTMLISSMVLHYFYFITYRWRLRGLEGWGKVGARKPLAIVPCGKHSMLTEAIDSPWFDSPCSSAFSICSILYIRYTEH